MAAANHTYKVELRVWRDVIPERITERTQVEHRMNTRLRRFWFSFDPAGNLSSRLGCGVTAWTREDALAILREHVPGDVDAIVQCVDDVDVSRLDPRHILPNIGDVAVRGIWFPRGGPPLPRGGSA